MEQNVAPAEPNPESILPVAHRGGEPEAPESNDPIDKLREEQKEKAAPAPDAIQRNEPSINLGAGNMHGEGVNGEPPPRAGNSGVVPPRGTPGALS